MININIRSRYNYPFLLKPVGKDYLWGGNRLNDDFSKGIDLTPLAETWECSTHPNGMSTIASGDYAGVLLGDMLRDQPQMLGKHSESLSSLPILIKFIDARQDLSIQVHPDDKYAFSHENGQNGKTEFWYILDATDDSHIIYGLHHAAGKSDIEKSIEEGTFESYLQRIKVTKDDIFLIKAGTIHAIGAGTLVAEVQQSSDLTYRLYDYKRKDKTGNLRELNISKALNVADLSAMPAPGQPMRVLRYSPGCAIELLERCQYFQVDRMLINTERIRNLVEYKTDELSFNVLICIGGCGSIMFENKMLNIFKGDCIFVPAYSTKMKIHGRLQLLKVSC